MNASHSPECDDAKNRVLLIRYRIYRIHKGSVRVVICEPEAEGAHNVTIFIIQHIL